MQKSFAGNRNIWDNDTQNQANLQNALVHLPCQDGASGDGVAGVCKLIREVGEE